MRSSNLPAQLGVLIFIVFGIHANAYSTVDANHLKKLYRSGQYFKCYKASVNAAKKYRSAAVPRLFAALAATGYKRDRALRAHLRHPHSRAMFMLQEAKKLDRDGIELRPYRKELTYLQRVIFKYASLGWKQEKEGYMKYFDALDQVFNQREGTWKNIYNSTTDNVDADYDFREWDNPYYRLANTAKKVRGLSPEMKDMIYLHNLCRANPKLFRDTYVKSFLGSRFHKNDNWYISTLIEDLSTLR